MTSLKQAHPSLFTETLTLQTANATADANYQFRSKAAGQSGNDGVTMKALFEEMRYDEVVRAGLDASAGAAHAVTWDRSDITERNKFKRQTIGDIWEVVSVVRPSHGGPMMRLMELYLKRSKDV